MTKTINLINKFLSEKNSKVVSIAFQGEKYSIDHFVAHELYADNELCIKKIEPNSKIIFDDFYFDTFQLYLNTITCKTNTALNENKIALIALLLDAINNSYKFKIELYDIIV